jgi:hypothetical protein
VNGTYQGIRSWLLMRTRDCFGPKFQTIFIFGKDVERDSFHTWGVWVPCLAPRCTASPTHFPSARLVSYAALNVSRKTNTDPQQDPWQCQPWTMRPLSHSSLTSSHCCPVPTCFQNKRSLLLLNSAFLQPRGATCFLDLVKVARL